MTGDVPSEVIFMSKLQPEDWNQLPVTGNAVVLDDWIDAMGHMNVMWYTHMFSLGVWNFFQMLGLTREYFVANQRGSFALEQHFRYLAEIRVGEKVTLRTRALSRSEKKLHFMGFLIKEEQGVLAATSEGVTAHIDMTCRRTTPFPSEITEAYDALLNKHLQLDWPAPVNGFTHS